MRVLVADDDGLFLEVVCQILRDAGHDVLTTKSGDEALERAVAEKPDIIILDIVLPGLLGHEVCESLRELKATANIPVLLVSSRVESMEEVVWGAKELLANDFLRKPFTGDVLLDRINRLMASTRT